MTRLLTRILERFKGPARRVFEETVADCACEARAARGARERWASIARGIAAVVRVVVAAYMSVEAPFREGFMDRLRSDFMYAWRRLWRTPGFTIVAILTLALGIGANTALFSLVNGLLFKSIPIPNLDRLVTLTEVTRSTGRVLIDLKDADRAAIAGSGLAMFDEFVLTDPLVGAVSGSGHADVVNGEIVTGNYFQVMGVFPRAGRLLQPMDDRDDGLDTPIVISERLWRRWFGAAPSAIGTAVKIADCPLVIVGVVPDAFKGTWQPTLLAADVWVPIRAENQVVTVQNLRNEPRTEHRTFATLHSGISLSQANAAVEVIGQRFHSRGSGEFLAALSGRDGIMLQEFSHYGFLLGSAVLALSGLVFLIACANLANLLLARGAARAGEMAIRLAIGASRGRILQLFLTETVLLTACAGVVGLVLTFATTWLMTTIPLPALQGITIRFDPSPDLRVFAYAFVVAWLAALAVGFVPAWRASRTEPLRVLASGGASGGATMRGQRLRTLLVASQVGMSMVLLVGAGLYVRSALKATRYDPGFDLSTGTMASVDLRFNHFDEARGRRLYRLMLEAAQQMPGVERAALVSALPAARRGKITMDILPEGQQPPPRAPGFYGASSAVSPGFFQTLGIRLQRGREFADTDVAASTPVAVVSQFAAATFWPHQDALGKRVRVSRNGPFCEVVGVVADTQAGWPGDAPSPFVYVPLEQQYSPAIAVVVRTGANPAATIDPLRSAMHNVDPDVPLFDVSTVADAVGLVLVPIRITAIVLGSLGVLGFGIAVLGLYGVIAYVVSQRTREFGIRKALGASGPQIYSTVLRQGVRMLLLGIVPGLVIAFMGAGLLQHLLYGIEPHDPLTFVAVALTLTFVGLAASIIPARRASRVEPNVALREL